VGTWLTHIIGRPLIDLNFKQQKFEANFRFALVRIREHAEGIALYRGEADELRHLTSRFGDVVRNCEQQRVAFARALLYKPLWLFMDEATASLDDSSETRLYALLRERLPDTSIVSVGYHPNLAQFHEQRVRLERDAAGLGRLVPG
jgi:ABC-type uncharacterized transport system fused permease/ATPase subunit